MLVLLLRSLAQAQEEGGLGGVMICLGMFGSREGRE